MEKLKVTHDHSLTDILKVLIFTLVLLIPGFMFLPSMLYFGFNEQANAPTKEAEIKEIYKIDFNQQENNLTLTVDNATNYFFGSIGTNPINVKTNDIFIVKYYQNCTFTANTRNTLQIRYTSNSFNRQDESQNRNLQAGWYYWRFTALHDYLQLGFWLQGAQPIQECEFSNIQLFNLTQMFGAGNEPTLEDFNNLFDDAYYEYTMSEQKLLERTISTETVVDITTQLDYNWQKIWNMPILSWTNHTILLDGLKEFTGVFGIVDTSYITNLITYELIIVGIYIVIDIVLTLFKWLTHMIGNK